LLSRAAYFYPDVILSNQPNAEQLSRYINELKNAITDNNDTSNDISVLDR
jgi:hypothetical protein